MNDLKFCRSCEKDKGIYDFYKKGEYADGRYPRCIECVKRKIYLPEKTLIINNKKQCTKCNEFKDLSFFSKRINRKSGVQSSCKKCKNKRVKRDPKKTREISLYKSYNISSLDFENILASQNNKCAICGIDQNSLKDGKKKYLCVDHCHITGSIRGLLCDKCNRGIGLLGDNIDNLFNAIDYLKKYK
jgi:hypothetical protein